MSPTHSWSGPLPTISQPDSERSGRHDCCRWVAAKRRLTLGCRSLLAHQTPDFLVIQEEALLTQRGTDPAIAVELERIAIGEDCLHDRSVVGRLLRSVVLGRTCNSHQPASFSDWDAAGPGETDAVRLLGPGAFLRAPFRNASSRACLSTRRSSAAIRASYS